MSLELEANEGPRISLGRDFLVFFLWLLWVLTLTSLKLPSWVYLPGFGFVLVYAAWIWGPVRATLFFLLMGWVYSSLSLTPGGLVFLSLGLSHVILKLIQFRFMVNSSFEFALAVTGAAFLYEMFQMWFMGQSYDTQVLSWGVLGIVILSMLFHFILGLMSYRSLERWIIAR